MCLIIINILINNNIAMNDSMSIFLATTILALGGLGLYMYKSSDDSVSNEDYNEEGFNWFWGGSNEDEIIEDKIDEDPINDDDDDIKPRKRVSKTHKNRKSSGNSKRRY
jgi:hypothetical protein